MVTSAPVLRTLARAHLQNNEPDLALEQYRHAVQVDPANNELRNEVADFMIRRGNADEARRLLDAVLAADPQNLVALELEYRAFTTAGDTTAANGVAGKIVAAYPDSPLGYYFQGLLYESKGDFASAKSLYERSLEKAPLGAEPLTALARVYVRTEKKEEAQAYLAKLVEKNPTHDVALNLLAELALSDRDFDRSIAYCDQAIRIEANW